MAFSGAKVTAGVVAGWQLLWSCCMLFVLQHYKSDAADGNYPSFVWLLATVIVYGACGYVDCTTIDSVRRLQRMVGHQGACMFACQCIRAFAPTDATGPLGSLLLATTIFATVQWAILFIVLLYKQRPEQVQAGF